MVVPIYHIYQLADIVVLIRVYTLGVQTLKEASFSTRK